MQLRQYCKGRREHNAAKSKKLAQMGRVKAQKLTMHLKKHFLQKVKKRKLK